MQVNNSNLRTLYTAFHAAFQGGLGMAPSQWDRVATRVPSSTSENEFGWLGQLPGMREWIGERVANAIGLHGYAIRNKSFESTVQVPRTAIEDEQYGNYATLFTEMGRGVAAHPNQLVFSLLKNGISTLCYDGQNFFDTDHPVINAAGDEVSQSNYTAAGGGPTWFLLDTSRALKPLIFQERQAPRFVAKDRDTDDNVFDLNVFKYGVDNRCNVGFGFWQLAFASNAALDETGLNAAYVAMSERTGDHGRPLGITPNLLVVRPSQKLAAAKLLSATTLANGADNVMKGLVDVIDVPWLV